MERSHVTPFFPLSLENKLYTGSFKRKKKKRQGEAQECLEWDVRTRAGRAQGLIWDKLDSCCKGYSTALLLCCHSSRGNTWAGVSLSGVIEVHLVTTFLKTCAVADIKGPRLRSRVTFVFGAAQTNPRDSSRRYQSLGASGWEDAILKAG